MNILYVNGDRPQETNCSLHNCIRPAEAVNKLEGHQAITIHIDEFSKNTPEIQEIAMKTDIIVIERNYFGDALTTKMYYKVRNKPIVCIFDDAYNYMHEKNVSYPFWKLGQVHYMNSDNVEAIGFMRPHPLQQFEWGLHISDAIQVPSRYLAQDWAKHGYTKHIPNYIEAEKYLNVEPLIPHDDIIIGWGGSLSHVSSFTDSGILNALKKVARRFDNVRIMITGDKRVYDLIDLPEGKKFFHNYVPVDQFKSLMKTFDIALAPLIGDYDKRRSWVKVLEYCAMQMPWVASDYPTYEDLKPYGHLVKNSTQAWYKQLIYMVEHLDEEREIAKGKPFEFAMNQSYEKNIGKTLDFYQEVINKFHNYKHEY